MKLLRRSGAPSAFTLLLGFAVGATCAATAACSSDSASSQGAGWIAGGGPLNGGSGGGGNGATSSGASSGGASSGTTSGSGGTGAGSSGASSSGSGGAPPGDAGAASDATAAADGAPAGDAAGTGEGGGEAGPPTFDFTLLNTTITGIVQGSPVTGYDPIAEAATINLAVTGTALSVRANTVPAVVGSVAFALDATYTHTENTAPYTLCGDDGAGTITSCASILTVGKHTLTATPYSAANLGGDAGAPAILDFVIVDVADAGAGEGGVTDAAGQ